MKYFITYSNPLSHVLTIRWEVEGIKETQFKVQLPIWRPGRYEAANYAKNISRIEFFDAAGSSLKSTRIKPSEWLIDTSDTSKVQIEYDYYAHVLDAGNSWLDEHQVYINFVNCMMYNEKRMDDVCIVELDIPSQYQIACGLQKEDDGKTLFAKDYYQLVDSPLMASASIEHYTYEASGVDFHIWLQGKHNLDIEKLKSDFIKFSNCQIEMMGEFPEKDYHFLIQLPAYKHYHGVEHGNSTVICIGPGKDVGGEELYPELLGVSSHELFHAWNILKIRPKELHPYNFSEAPVFPTGYVAEGFTTYYGDLLLVRSCVFDKNWYLGELNKLLKRHFWNYGRLNESVVDSSIGLWFDGYQASAPNGKSSIYTEGAVTALLLDLLVRKTTNQAKSLDDVVRLLWRRFGKTKIGYSHGDIKQAAEEVYGSDLREFFDDYIDGVKDKEQMLLDLFEEHGVNLQKAFPDSSISQKLGVVIVKVKNDFIVKLIQPKSLGEAHFSIGDKVLSINRQEVTDDLLKQITDDSLHFEIERNSEIKSIEIKCLQKNYLSYPQLTRDTFIYNENLKNWL